jgi:hypothetical protein
MITKEEYQEIASKWPVMKRDGRVLEPYQHWQRLDFRLRYFCQYLDQFKDMDVAEVGCNAGMYGYEIAKVAKSYTGVDISERFIAEANVTKTFIEKFNVNVSFICRPVKGWLRDRQKARERGETVAPVNALFASFALYHLSDMECRLLGEEILPGCQLVLIQTRTAKRKKMSNHNSWEFWKPKQVAKYLRQYGFETEIIDGPPKKGNEKLGPNFSEIFARRKA